jgi:maltose alpha-D-glucosyltransferase/alpha-amylase
VWSDRTDRYAGTRIIFKDFEPSNWSWDPVAGAYFWHRFYAHQPDLNFDHPRVREALFKVVDFWMRLGVDGMRLDAVPYLYEREGTDCENLPETHAFLRALRAHVDRHWPDRVLLAEANQWPEDAVAYFGHGDECHMAFHFPLMPRLFMGLRLEDRHPVVDILQQTPPIPEPCQWALFLRNHDELTLEMVTDEDRDYMYRVYAEDPRARINLGIRRRMAPLLGNDRRRIELLHGLLFSLPGTPVLYYGDEIGMGDNIHLGDRNGVRTPMQWSADRNAGFSRANPQQLYLPAVVDPEYHFTAVNVENQSRNPHSLLWWIKRLLALRQSTPAFGHGSFSFVLPDSRKTLGFLRRHGDDVVLVVANLSRFAQPVEMDLAPFQGWRPVEMFGRTPFPRLGAGPYALTLSPHAFHWFRLVPPGAREIPPPPASLSVLGGLEVLGSGTGREALERVLPGWLRRRPWFRGSELLGAQIAGMVPLETAQGTPGVLLVARADALEGEADLLALPLAASFGQEAAAAADRDGVLARLEGLPSEGVLHDGLLSGPLPALLAEACARRRRWRAGAIEVLAVPIGGEVLPGRAQEVRQRDGRSDVVFADGLRLVWFHRLEGGVRPELEIRRFLTERRGFPHAAHAAGYLQITGATREPATAAVLVRELPDLGPARQVVHDHLARYLDRAATADSLTGAAVQDAAGAWIALARRMGEVTAALHRALSDPDGGPAFAPEPFPPNHQRVLYQTLRGAVRDVLDRLAAARDQLPPETQDRVQAVLARGDLLLERARRITGLRLPVQRQRVHGELRLERLGLRGQDVVVTSFAGEPWRPAGEARLKRSPLRDVASMLLSFSRAADTALTRWAVRPEDARRLAPWCAAWAQAVRGAFLEAYRIAADGAPFLPQGEGADRVLTGLLAHYGEEKAVSEVRYALLDRPEDLPIALQGVLDLTGQERT